MHRYVYGLNNPKVYVDPDGRIVGLVIGVADLGLSIINLVGVYKNKPGDGDALTDAWMGVGIGLVSVLVNAIPVVGDIVDIVNITNIVTATLRGLRDEHDNRDEPYTYQSSIHNLVYKATRKLAGKFIDNVPDIPEIEVPNPCPNQ